MKLNELIARGGTSFADQSGIDGSRFSKLNSHLSGFTFRRSNPTRRRKIWEPQEAALGMVAAYLCADRRLPLEEIANEAALVKMPTGTGKSAVITVLCRCLPMIRRALVLTPREALTDQLYRYVRRGFWSRMDYVVDDQALFSDENGRATGNPVPSAYIAKLLPSTVKSILDADPTQERMVLVGTLQAMDMIRRDAQKAIEPSPTTDSLRAADLLKLIGKFDLVVVDEGHYEPAISWSRAIRDADLPTVLFSATPYRNDYKSFRVRGRFVFNQPIDDAIGERIIRKPRFAQLDGFARLPSKSAISPLSELTDDTETDAQHSVRDRADAAKFAKALVLAAKSIATPPGVEHPKIIVRADERAKLDMLHDEIERVSGESALTIHHAIKRNDASKRRFNSVKAAQSIPANAEVRYWLHQTKLLEGVDDSSFVAVAVYDVFGNARQLVQQIGRVLRSSDERRKNRQEAVVMASPEMVSRMEESWDHYLDFERYCAKNTNYLVTNEAALPDRLLATMPDVQYIEGQFRPRFMIEGKLDLDDIRLPASAAVFRLGGSFDKSVVRSEIVEAILNEDRFKPIEISGLPDEAIAIAYYGWQTSSLLTRQFFPEWKLGVCIVVRSGNLVLAHDTGGIVFDADKLGLGRMDQTDFARGIPASSSGKPVRVARISSASLDMSELAIRSQATRTRSFENTFTDLLDPAMVPTSSYAFLGRFGRYLGLTRARIRDAFPEPLLLAQYLEWRGLSRTSSGTVPAPIIRSSRDMRASPPYRSATRPTPKTSCWISETASRISYTTSMTSACAPRWWMRITTTSARM
ncbi:DEAD/DEAH box helicase family protein [Bradyrhizobium yuanmingense]|uniref:DEAD/DEAH box helicase n=1 Tax=Bradyrhizobium yuanmingense TaxID=108015 RepID=UPI0023B97365|nr:DEAD/DEAH box helicase family protein [Bradyrhizobium yuanmingense]MDF0522945.1 DEAD/DEAH box helicase family protein [Bradyrhizobium yuanmingense]